MITIFHGDDTSSSRKLFIEQKENAQNSQSFFGEKLEISSLVQIFDGGGLFSDEKQIFIEDLLSKRKPSKEFDEIINYIASIKDGSVYLWENKALTKKQLNYFPKATVKESKLPQVLFTFLDNLLPGNSKHAISLFHQAILRSEPELLFYMIVRHFRLLLAVTDKSLENIDEVLKMSPWQKSKLEKQSRSFTKEHLVKILKKLMNIDYFQKTGQSQLSLTQNIDMFLLSDV